MTLIDHVWVHAAEDPATGELLVHRGRRAACDGCLHGWPVIACAVTGAPVHRGPDFPMDCRQPEPTAEEVERVARWLRQVASDAPSWTCWVSRQERDEWSVLARASIAAGLVPSRVG